MKLKSLVTSTDRWATRLTESSNASGTVYGEVLLLTEQVVRVDAWKRVSQKVVSAVCEESEERTVRSKIACVGRNQAEKLTGSLVTESVNAMDLFLQQLKHDTINRLLQELEETY